jgi:hypothetical protein
MIKDELFERSPIRCFDKATGGLKAGELGLLTSKKGLGKTSVLVQFGVDTLLQDKQVIHVSFDQQSANVITWYQDIFTEIAKKKNITNINELVTELVRKRIILNFHQDAMALAHIVTTLEALAQGGIQASCLVVDGVDLTKLKVEDVQAIADYANKAGVAVWFSASTDAADLNGTLAADLQGLFQAIIRLEAKTDMIELMILKLRDEAARSAGLKLDSKTLLIAEK